MSIDEALGAIGAALGDERRPARSTLGRFWQKLDELLGDRG
jgi:hypothetical protein